MRWGERLIHEVYHEVGEDTIMRWGERETHEVYMYNEGERGHTLISGERVTHHEGGEDTQ